MEDSAAQEMVQYMAIATPVGFEHYAVFLLSAIGMAGWTYSRWMRRRAEETLYRRDEIIRSLERSTTTPWKPALVEANFSGKTCAYCSRQSNDSSCPGCGARRR